MPAKYRTDDDRFEVIRPLVECPEDLIRRFAELSGYPILPCSLCGSQPNLQRDRMTALLDELERTHPDVRSVMAAALTNVKASHLLDRHLLGLAPSGPAEAPKRRTEHAGALPIAGRKLPVVS